MNSCWGGGWEGDSGSADFDSKFVEFNNVTVKPEGNSDSTRNGGSRVRWETFSVSDVYNETRAVEEYVIATVLEVIEEFVKGFKVRISVSHTGSSGGRWVWFDWRAVNSGKVIDVCDIISGTGATSFEGVIVWLAVLSGWASTWIWEGTSSRIGDARNAISENWFNFTSSGQR